MRFSHLSDSNDIKKCHMFSVDVKPGRGWKILSLRPDVVISSACGGSAKLTELRLKFAQLGTQLYRLDSG